MKNAYFEEYYAHWLQWGGFRKSYVVKTKTAWKKIYP